MKQPTLKEEKPLRRYVLCDIHGWQEAFNVPGLTGGKWICEDCI